MCNLLHTVHFVFMMMSRVFYFAQLAEQVLLCLVSFPNEDLNTGMEKCDLLAGRGRTMTELNKIKTHRANLSEDAFFFYWKYDDYLVF